MPLPAPFLDRMERLLGDQAPAFLASYESLPRTGLRVNTLKIAPEAFRQLAPFELTPVPWCAAGFTIVGADAEPGKHPYHAAGLYYLQVDAESASDSLPTVYQSWRSPVVEVISDVVHVNVPLTPDEGPEPAWVYLRPDDLVPAVITVPVGSTIGWIPWLDATAPITDLVRLTENPIFQPRSGGALDPLISTLGFDGGMLRPGDVYHRLFLEPGVYPYTDGAGRSGIVVVEADDYRIYLPLVRRP